MRLVWLVRRVVMVKEVHTLLIHNLKRISVVGLILTRVPKRLAKARGCAAAMRLEAGVHLSACGSEGQDR